MQLFEKSKISDFGILEFRFWILDFTKSEFQFAVVRMLLFVTRSFSIPPSSQMLPRNKDTGIYL
jgi:hypothetical protein